MPDRNALFKTLGSQPPLSPEDLMKRRPQISSMVETPNSARERLSTFIERAQKSLASTDIINTWDEMDQAIKRYCQSKDIPATHIMASPEMANRMKNSNLTLTQWQSHCEAKIGISKADSGIIETGSLLITSKANNPISLCFLAEHHIVLLEEKHLLGTLTEGLTMVQAAYPKTPRNINFITGPSRTGDIEATFAMGVHGPASLHIIILANA